MEGRIALGARFFDFCEHDETRQDETVLLCAQYPTLKRTFVCDTVYFSFSFLSYFFLVHVLSIFRMAQKLNTPFFRDAYRHVPTSSPYHTPNTSSTSSLTPSVSSTSSTRPATSSGSQFLQVPQHGLRHKLRQRASSDASDASLRERVDELAGFRRDLRFVG
jgi:hypothetical protein